LEIWKFDNLEIIVRRFEGKEGHDFVVALEIRTIVFVIGQNVPVELEQDEFDASAHHYLLFLEEKAVATARWRETEKGIKLERFAVLDGYRSKGLGEAILMAVLNDVLPLKRLIYLHAQEAAVDFYLRHGFSIVSDRFLEAGIGHYLMTFG